MISSDDPFRTEGLRTDTHHTLPLEKGGQIRLIRLAGTRALSPPLILAHGTLSNAGTVWSLGAFLAAEGHDVWLLEWGGHGSSTAPCTRRNFEAPAFEELPRALDFVRERTGSREIFWVGHSGGGLLPLMYLARYPERQSLFGGLVTLGAQTTGAAESRAHKFRAFGLYGLTMVLGRTPKIRAAMGDEGEPTALLAQWAVWNLRQQWMGKDGFNYMDALSGVTVPCMILAGTRDDIAPEQGCLRVFDALGSQDKTWVSCGGGNGFSRDFSHGGLVRGGAARSEIFPKVGAWLKVRTRA